MQQLSNYISTFLFLFVCFEPLHFLEISGTSSNNGESSDTELNVLITDILSRNDTALPKAEPLPSKLKTNENSTRSYYNTHVENYPDYAEIAPKLKKFQAFLSKDVSPQPDLPSHTPLEGDADQHQNFCSARTEVIIPREILNEAKKPVKVVNFYGVFNQAIRTEICSAPDIACRYSELFPHNLMPICKQNYIFVTMVTMDDNNDPQYENIPIPAGCVCVLKDMTLG